MNSTNLSTDVDFYPDTAGDGNPSAFLTTITPSKAKDWLARGTNFRSATSTRISALAQTIRSGHWELNGETIKFDHNGHLIDGQHRLNAIVRAQTPVKSFVVVGLSSGREIDRGNKRTLAQQLAFEGFSNAPTVAAISRLYLVYEHNIKTESTSFHNSQQDVKKSVEFCHANSETIAECVRFTGSMYRMNRVLPVSVAGAFLLICGDNSHTRQFIRQVYDQGHLDPTCPAFAFRRWLEGNARKNGGKLGLNSYQVLAVLNRAWHNFATGRSVSHMKVTHQHLRWSPSQNPIRSADSYGLS